MLNIMARLREPHSSCECDVGVKIGRLCIVLLTPLKARKLAIFMLTATARSRITEQSDTAQFCGHMGSNKLRKKFSFPN
jgi:hypothetical protein